MFSIPGELILSKKYQNQDFGSFLAVLQQFLSDAGATKPPLAACFAVAGPVKNNVVRFTNRDTWHIDGDEIAEQLGIGAVRLINDFLAVGYGILTLDEEKECLVLQVSFYPSKRSKTTNNQKKKNKHIGRQKGSESTNCLYWRRHWSRPMLLDAQS